MNSLYKNIIGATLITASFAAAGSDSIGEALGDIYIDSVITPSTRLELERLLDNSEATIDHQTRPDVVEERVRGAIGNQKLEQMLENDRLEHE